MRTPQGCWYMTRKADNKKGPAGAPLDRFQVKIPPDYAAEHPELYPTPTVVYLALNQLAAVVAVQDVGVTREDVERIAAEGAKKGLGMPEASHHCRYATTEFVSSPRGPVSKPRMVEASHCFAVPHVFLELWAMNIKRRRCRGAPFCPHQPHRCFCVDRPDGL